MFLIVGLGNPGPQYSLTRHNIGFICLDFFSKSLGGPSTWNNEHKAQTQVLRHGDHKVLLAKPQTFMNRSGESVVSLMQFYKIEPAQLLVIQDDMDFAFMKMKFQRNRGHAGHNGIRNISELFGHSDYARLKLGIGRPPHPEMNVADYVLQKFSKEEQDQLPHFLNTAGDGIESFIAHGLEKTATLFNK